jgi:PAS domain S-box-containing protein
MTHVGTVLVVDDDPQALAMLTGILEEHGYLVQPADSGKLALLSVAAQAPDLVLLDVKMPGMDGFEVCRRIKSMETGHRIPVMFVSGSRNTEEWVQGLSLGAVDFLSKPFQREEMLARVRTHVELGRLQMNLESVIAQRTAELRNAVEQLQLEIADRRRAEQSLRESEHRFRLIANAAPVIIWNSDTNNQTIFCNEYAATFCGRPMEELLGGAWTELVHPDDRDLQRRAAVQAIQSRCGFQVEYRLRRADGEYRWMLDRGTPRFLHNGELAGYIGVVLDLSDVKVSHERAMREKNLENLRVLSAGIAHDFNTLVGAIFGEVDLALADMAPDAPGRGSVERIDAVAKRAAEIVRLLMAYVGDQSNGERLELVDLTALVQEIVPHLKSPILKKSEIRTRLERRLPSIRANVMQMRLVVLNLIINAMEALQGEKGVVTVGTAAVEISADSADESSPAGPYVKLEVSDTGHGMAESVQNRIFDPYYTTKSMGRGLGLAAVQGIIRSHRGSITACSVPGRGTTFDVLLPAAVLTQVETTPESE